MESGQCIHSEKEIFFFSWTAGNMGVNFWEYLNIGFAEPSLYGVFCFCYTTAFITHWLFFTWCICISFININVNSKFMSDGV